MTYRGIIGAVEELDYFIAHIRLREPNKLEHKAEWVNFVTKNAKENKIGVSPTKW